MSELHRSEEEMQAEIERILSIPENELPVEQAMAPEDSPLNQPVVEKEFASPPPSRQAEPTSTGELPVEMARLAASSILTTTNNLIGLGAGYFVKIKRHKEFVEIDEVIQLIDAQNEKNVRAMKLDEEDKAMLMPLLVQVLRKRAKAPTPEQQLLMVALTIVMKKAQVFIQIRKENQELTDQILEAIRQSKDQAGPVPADQAATASAPVDTSHEGKDQPGTQAEVAELKPVGNEMEMKKTNEHQHRENIEDLPEPGEEHPIEEMISTRVKNPETSDGEDADDPGYS